MKVLVVGQGGREHVLAWKLTQSPQVDTVFCAPGNAGTARAAENVPIAVDDIDGLVRFVASNDIGLTVIGPEAPLVAGLADALRAANRLVFGPSRAAAQLEGSKAFAKEVMRHAGVPTADAWSFDSPRAALEFLEERPEEPVVVKADGLASGKGVTVCQTREEAFRAVREIGFDRAFGAAGDRILIEERLVGREVSILAIVDGKSILPLEAAEDHKAAYDGDRGPNTGGMGAYSPTPSVTPEVLDAVISKILIPTVHEMKRQKKPFQGVLYAGLMLTNQGPKVLEFNVRLGDPEAQPVLMRLKTDLFEVLHAAAEGRLGKLPDLEWDPRPAVCVVMASEGYPGSYEKGKPIRGLQDVSDENVQVFHAGTALRQGQIVTDGGRVLGVTAIGDDLAGAKYRAYAAVKQIRWEGAWCRKDISDKARS
jgi:phosphoribosylamine--glycine ligase